MTITTTLISGDDSETAVFAACYCGDLSLIFRFLRDSGSPTSINSRIVNHFHQAEVEDGAETYADGDSMRAAIKYSVTVVWRACASHPSIRLPDVIVQIQEERSGIVSWSICHESCFHKYVDSLWSPKMVQKTITQNLEAEYKCVPLETLQFSDVLGGRGGVTIVELGGNRASGKYVYKGLSFRLFLESNADFQTERDTFYHELGIIFKISKHPNIVQAPSMLITTQKVQNHDDITDRYMCGALYPYLQRRSLQEVVEDANMKGIRISLRSKAKWSYQIASAMESVHSLQEFHMDLKPSNVLVDDHDNAVIIDWEQLGASPFFLAPEACGTYDVELVALNATNDGKTNSFEMRYKEHTGTSLEVSRTWPRRNVYKTWRTDCPPALEAAEVFSLGRTIWVILEQLGEESFDNERSDFKTKPVKWTTRSDDIPQLWKNFVEHSTCVDPNERGSFNNAREFWLRELKFWNMSRNVNFSELVALQTCG